MTTKHSSLVLFATAATIIAAILIAAAGTACNKSHPSGTRPLPEKKAIVTTIAGTGIAGFAEGPALSAQFKDPTDVAVGADGALYIADYGNHRITLDAAGSLYILDEDIPYIRKISAAADVSGYAGTDTPGYLNGAASIAMFQSDEGGIAADAQGNIYIGDSFNDCIRKIGLAGEVTTLAGTDTEGFVDGDGARARFRIPDGIAVDKQGNIYVGDGGNVCIRKITPGGQVSRFAGSGTPGTADGNAASAQFQTIGDIVADGEGNLYVTDEDRIRKIKPNGDVTTIAGSTKGYADGDGSAAKFASPAGLGIDGQGNVYLADILNQRIRKISFQ